jgi:hypothetical protein
VQTYAPVRRPITWWWFLVPLLTCGLGTFVMVVVGGVRLRSRRTIIAAFGYLALTIVFAVGVQFTEPDKTGLIDVLVLPVFLVNWLGGTAHAAVLSSRVRNLVPAPPPIPRMVDPAIAAAQWRMNRRMEARQILATNAVLAAELRIGRPDLMRQYDDGGLVDVNHVPAKALTGTLDLPPAVAAAVVSERDRLGGFSSPDELVVYCDGVTPERLAVIRDRLIFVPR